jgi:hypothetical protein
VGLDRIGSDRVPVGIFKLVIYSSETMLNEYRLLYMDWFQGKKDILFNNNILEQAVERTE